VNHFTEFLNTIPDEVSSATKIALISDGLDTASNSLAEKIAQVQPGSHIPHGNLGTVAATLITQICPKSRLYIARVEEEKTGPGSGRHVVAGSAAKVSYGSTTSGASSSQSQGDHVGNRMPGRYYFH